MAAFSRSADAFDGLAETHGEAILPLRVDITDRAEVLDAVRRVTEHFGGIDIVINNADYGLFGMVEEVTELQARDQLEVNLFGSLWVTQAVLPYLRGRGSGHLIQVSSIAGVYSLPGLGLYHASKFAVEGFTASLAAEVEDFGVKVTLIEPAGYATDWAGSSAVQAERSSVYDDFRAAMTRPAAKRGEPGATRAAILQIVDADEPPLRIFFGQGPLPLIKKEYAARIEEWERWDEVSQAAFGG